MEIRTEFGRRTAPMFEEQKTSKRVKPYISGLSDEEAAISKKLYGENTFTEKKKRSLVKEFFKNLSDPIIRILILAMFVNILFTIRNINWIEIAGIAITVFIAAFVSTLSEFSSGAVYDKLFKADQVRAYSVYRNGIPEEKTSSEIVRFDKIDLSAGEIVPCDGFLVEGSLICDEASLTGEAKGIKKYHTSLESLDESFIGSNSKGSCPSFIYGGSSILSGEGAMICTSIGNETIYGKIAAELQTVEEPSPLKERLTTLARTISKLGYIGAAIVAVVYLFNTFIISSGFDSTIIIAKVSDLKNLAAEIIHALTIAISIVVVAVPEGLPMMITVVLSANMKKMMKDGVLVRRLVGIETAGSLSLLFTDKTGTITTGNLKLSRITVNGKDIIPADLTEFPEIFDEIRRGIEYCTGKNGGNQTDRALRSVLGARVKQKECIDRIPFDSSYKYSAVLYNDNGARKTIIRGAPETVMAMCSSYMDINGEIYNTEEEIHFAPNNANRSICHAIGDEASFRMLKSGRIPHNMVYVCTYILKDEIRQSVPAAVSSCKEAGIKVVMLTGDNEATGAAVAIDAGILPKDYSIYDGNRKECKNIVMNGDHLRKISDDTLKTILPEIRVIARTTPSDKSRLIRIAKELGHVVGMTGDGVNDTPALKSADVGFAMGSGTDAAREAGDIIITDNNFASITKSVLYGRTIFESIRKFILFQLTMNLCAVGVSLIAPFLGIETPITITQMLWINIIMDTLGSLAFAGDVPLKSYMKRPPIKRSEPILDKKIIRRILFNGAYTLFLSLLFLCSGSICSVYKHNDQIYCLTVFFALFVFCGIANAFCARSTRVNVFASLWQSRAFMTIMIPVAAIQLIIIYFGGAAFRTVPLEISDLALACAASTSVFLADIICKIFFTGRASQKSNFNTERSSKTTAGRSHVRYNISER